MLFWRMADKALIVEAVSVEDLVLAAPLVEPLLSATRTTLCPMISTVRVFKDNWHDTPFAPGDVYISNNPYNGGTHLPDITATRANFYRWVDRTSILRGFAGTLCRYWRDYTWFNATP